MFKEVFVRKKKNIRAHSRPNKPNQTQWTTNSPLSLVFYSAYVISHIYSLFHYFLSISLCPLFLLFYYFLVSSYSMFILNKFWFKNFLSVSICPPFNYNMKINSKYSETSYWYYIGRIDAKENYLTDLEMVEKKLLRNGVVSPSFGAHLWMWS